MRLLISDGHYIAYCRSEFDQQWYEYDDSRVTQVSEIEVASKEAYVLLYRKKEELRTETAELLNSSEEQDELASDKEDEWSSAL